MGLDKKKTDGTDQKLPDWISLPAGLWHTPWALNQTMFLYLLTLTKQENHNGKHASCYYSFGMKLTPTGKIVNELLVSSQCFYIFKFYEQNILLS